jgi:hypothetical protein
MSNNNDTPETVAAPPVVETTDGIDGEGGYIFHVLGHFKDRIQTFVGGLTETELLIMLSFLTGAIVSSSEKKASANKLFIDIANRFAGAYPEIVQAAKEKGLIATDSTSVPIIVPLVPGLNYTERPDIRLYLMKPSTTNIQ